MKHLLLPSTSNFLSFQLVQIINKLRQLEQEGGFSSFDPKCTIFVCNNWDLVKKQAGKDETLVWEDIKDKLAGQFSNISKDQIFRISAATEVSSVCFRKFKVFTFKR